MPKTIVVRVYELLIPDGSLLDCDSALTNYLVLLLIDCITVEIEH